MPIFAGQMDDGAAGSAVSCPEPDAFPQVPSDGGKTDVDAAPPQSRAPGTGHAPVSRHVPDDRLDPAARHADLDIARVPPFADASG